jgi:DNA-binding CsgD family transcriptional regulator
VAQGRPDPDIAAGLFLSRNILQRHVSHILAKLGARSCTEIVAEALRHQPPSMPGSQAEPA